MISVEAPLLVAGTVVFRDGEDPDQFWALPGSPHLAPTTDGGSSFRLLEYRSADGFGGGFAELEIELSLPSSAALSSVSGRPNARLSPVLFRSGDVSLLTMQGQGDALVQAVLGASNAPLAPPFHTVFALDVSEQGASLLAQAATDAATPIGVVYQLRFLAQTPALHAHVTMAYDRIYDHFSMSLGFTYYVSVRLDTDLSWLVEHGLVTIEITQFTDQVDQQRQQTAVLDLVRARIQSDFFHTSLPQDPGDNGLPGSLGQVVGQLGSKVTSQSALYVLKARLDIEKELKTFEISYDGKTVEELTHVVSGFVGAMVPGAPTAPVITQITADDKFFATMDVTTTTAVDYDQLPDLREVAITLTYGSHTATFVAAKDSPGPFRFTCPSDPAVPDYQTHVEFHFDSSSAAGPATMTAPDIRLRERMFVVSSADAFTVLRLRATAAQGFSDLVPTFTVSLRVLPVAGGDALLHDQLVLDAGTLQRDWYRRLPLVAGDVRLLASTGWTDKHGSTHQGDETEVLGGDYLAMGPVRELMDVQVEPSVDWQKVSQLVVEVRHQVLGTEQATSLTFTGGTPPQTVTLALEDPTKRGYEWKATVLRTDATTGSTDWTPADSQLLVVTDAAPRQAGVRVVWIGDMGTALALRVDFWVSTASVEQQVASALLQPGQTDTTVTLPGDQTTPPPYRYEVHRIDATGDTLVKKGDDSTRLLVVRTNG